MGPKSREIPGKFIVLTNWPHENSFNIGYFVEFIFEDLNKSLNCIHLEESQVWTAPN